MNVLVVGGAGYIGSHVIRHLDAAGYRVVVLDNLSTGHAEAVTVGKLVTGEMGDVSLVSQVLDEHQIDSVMHFAAFALVGESVSEPAKYYENNVVATLRLLQAMRQCEVKRIVFSSTCATYGIPPIVPISENTIQNPVNPYGVTKLTVERILSDYSQAYGIGYAALRYFNAAGAAPQGDIGEHHDPETHLIPIVLQAALGQRPSCTIFGDDWPTPDRTCVRDYIHVDDLATAHLSALERIEPGGGMAVNLGTGRGFSVREVIEACRRATSVDIMETIGPRRLGDPPELVADASMARKVLRWEPAHSSLDRIVETAWKWHQQNPCGFRSDESLRPSTRQSFRSP